MGRGTEAITVGAVPVQSEPVCHPSAGEEPRELEQEQRLCNPGTDCTHSSTLQLEWDAPK